jgi:hypothetical protein
MTNDARAQKLRATFDPRFFSSMRLSIPACLLILSTLCTAADTVAIRLNRSADGLQVVLEVPDPMEVKHSSAGRELLLEFSHSPESVDLDQLVSLAPDWLEAASGGYDTMLLRAARDVEFSVNAADRQIMIILRPVSPAQTSVELDQKKSQMRLDLVEARLLNAMGHDKESARLLEALSAQYPDDPTVLTGLANINQQIGRWRRADDLYGRAIVIDPGNEDFVEARRHLQQELGSRASLNIVRKSVSHAQREDVLQIRGQASFAHYLQFGLSLDQNSVVIGSVRRADGPVSGFRGVRRRAELYANQLFECGPRLTESLFLSVGSPGAALSLSRPDPAGSTMLSAEYRRPYWEFAEGLIDGGVRDRLEIHREQRISPRVGIWLDASFNRYGIRNTGNVAGSAALAGAIGYKLLKDGSLSLQYGFDAEYRLHAEARSASDGASFYPIPLVSREVHAPGVFAARRITRALTADCFAGFAKDRYSGSGPFVEAKIVGDLGRNIEARIAFERRLNSINTGEVVHRLTAQIIWKGP